MLLETGQSHVFFRATHNPRAARPGISGSYGVAELGAVETMALNGAEQRFRRARLLETDQHVLLPLDRPLGGLRPLCDVGQLPEIEATLGQPPGSPALALFMQQPWNRRYRSLVEQLLIGDTLMLAGCGVRIRQLSLQRELSFGERHLLDLASSALICEIAVVSGQPLEDTRRRLLSRLEAAGWPPEEGNKIG
jgi:CarD family transcriptional regulator